MYLYLNKAIISLSVLLSLFFVSCKSAPENHDSVTPDQVTTRTITAPGPVDLHPAIRFAVSGDNGHCMLTYIDKSKSVMVEELIDRDGILVPHDTRSIYTYEKADEIIHLEIDTAGDYQIVSHIEKYSYIVVATILENGKEPYNLHVGLSKMPSSMMLGKNRFAVLYVDAEHNSIIYKRWNRNNRNLVVQRDATENCINLRVSTDYTSGNIVSIWQTADTRDIYCSTMNERLSGLHPVTKLQFSQEIELPYGLIDAETLLLVFLSDYRYKYLVDPLGGPLVDAEVNEVPDQEPDFMLLGLCRADTSWCMLYGKTSLTADNRQQDILKATVYSDSFSKVTNYIVAGINGTVLQTELLYLFNSLYIFWTEEIDGQIILKFTSISL